MALYFSTWCVQILAWKYKDSFTAFVITLAAWQICHELSFDGLRVMFGASEKKRQSEFEIRDIFQIMT